MTTQESFGQLLRRYRRDAELTQEGLAERAGISVRAVQGIEAGSPHRPRSDTLQLLMQALAIPEEEQATFLAAAHDGAAPTETDSPSATRVQTFLVADIRGYTRFTAEHGDEAAARLTDRFAEVTRSVVGRFGGTVTELRGDEALAVFDSPRSALHAALALQAQFETVRVRDPDLPLEVGIGIDAGEGVPVQGGYRTGALNLAARLCALAGGGDVFVSEGVIHLARTMNDVVYLDRGETQVKGLARPVRVIQAVTSGAEPQDVPRFTAGARPRSALPLQPTRFIGRERELKEVHERLVQEDIRVLTLTGPGGTGKTRLALEAAGRAIGAFPDGVVYVSLASLADPSLVASTIAAAVELPEMAGRSLIDRLTDHLGEKQLLLVLDNFEHLLEARTVVQQLVSQCAALAVLVTSRAALHLTAEHEYAVPSLSLPDLSHLPELEALSHYDAVALFIQRAQAVRADFALTDDSAPAVAEICSRLDGLPLAIELAAARTKLFPPKALLTRLQHRLRLLTGGAKDLPQRQQTLRATIDWSYSLLSPAEQALFARLSVFAGGCTFEAADSVCNARGDLDLLEGIASLVEQSLLRQVGTDEPRFVMLETTREYAAEKLSDSGHEAETAQRHARYFLAYAEEARADQDRSHTESALERLAAEIDNLRAAVRWSIDHGDVEMGLRIASAFVSTLPLVSWSYYTDEVWNWCQEIFTLDRRTVSPHLRASALLRAAVVAQFVGSAHQARLLVDEVISLLDEIEDKRDRAVLAGEAGWIMRELGDYAHATPLLEMALPLFRDLDDEWGVAQTLLSLGEVAREQGDAEATVTCCSESLRLYRELGDGVGSGWSLYDLGLAAWMTGDFEQATHLYKEAMRVIRAGDYEVGIPDALMALGLVLRDQDDLAEAERVLADALEYCEGTRAYLYPAPMALEAMAGVATATGEYDRAATLFGAASSLRERIGFAVWPVLRSRHETDLAAIEEALGAEQFSRAWDMGHAMTTEQAVAYARESSGRSGG